MINKRASPSLIVALPVLGLLAAPATARAPRYGRRNYQLYRRAGG